MATNKGFSLIELMITIAIIGILVLMGYPSYKQYTTRVYLTEGLSVLSHYDTQILEDLTLSTDRNKQYPASSPNAMIEDVGVWFNTNPYSSGVFVRGSLDLSAKKVFGGRKAPYSAGSDHLQLVRLISTENKIVSFQYQGNINYYLVRRMTEDDINNASGFKVICGIADHTLMSPSEALSYFPYLPKECRNVLGTTDG